MKKNIFYSLLLALAVITLGSCDKDTEGLSSVIDYPILTIEGDEFLISPIGEAYVDPGCTATFQGADYTSNIVVEGVEDIDVNVPGLYYVTYTAVGPNGFSWSATRTVAVCDPSVDTDLSGTWTTTDATYRQTTSQVFYPGCTTEIKYLCPGIFQIKDYLAGYYSQYVGYQAAYPGYDFDVEGIFQLTADNEIVFVSGGPAAAFGSDLPSDFSEGAYDLATNTLHWQIVWSGMAFNVTLTK
ncbi:MAG: DUF5012 domain-containing protein [Prevotella sp.]|nr:DUF5012 domain-containing protein [Prevotella sp.]